MICILYIVIFLVQHSSMSMRTKMPLIFSIKNQGTSIQYQVQPTSSVGLYLFKSAITCKHKQEVRKLSCSQDLRQYLIHFQLKSNTPDLVWREVAHGSTIRYLLPFDDRRRTHKYIMFDGSPLIVNKYENVVRVIYVHHVAR